MTDLQIGQLVLSLAVLVAFAAPTTIRWFKHRRRNSVHKILKSLLKHHLLNTRIGRGRMDIELSMIVKTLPMLDLQIRRKRQSCKFCLGFFPRRS